MLPQLFGGKYNECFLTWIVNDTSLSLLGLKLAVDKLEGFIETK